MKDLDLMEMLGGKIVSCPQSAGINSAGVLCWLKEIGVMPKELHLRYAHFEEHSPDSMDFVLALFEMAKSHFPKVITEITYNSALAFFEEQKIIPHPAISPCSKKLKIEPALLYNALNNVQFDLIGYVRSEVRRMNNSQGKNDLFLKTIFPLDEFSDEWCFDIVLKHLGWYPKIYDIKDRDGNRLFKHNNCLPCKNMTLEELELVALYYPELWAKAMELSRKLQRHWGRNADDFYTTFGKDSCFGGGQQCATCSFD